MKRKEFSPEPGRPLGAATVQSGVGVMDDSTQRRRRRRGVWPPAARTAAAIFAMAAVALLGACSSSPSSVAAGGSPHATESATSPSALAYAACMRSHAVPNYPDPDGGGQLPKTDAQILKVSSSQYQAAQQACQHLLPIGSSLQQEEAQCGQDNDCSPALEQQWLTGDLKLARCMRSHGQPKFPDPANGGTGAPYFPISQVGISENASRTPQFVAELNECQRITGDNAPESFG